MGTQRFNFADQEPDPPPKYFWLTRLLVTGMITGCAAFAHIQLGFRFF